MFWAFCCLLVLCAENSLTEAGRADILDEFYTFDTAFPVTTVLSQVLPSAKRSKRNLRDRDFQFRRHEAQDFQVNPRHGNDRNILFKAFGKSFDVDLTLNAQLVREGFEVTVQSQNGSRTYRPTVEKCHYQGRLRDVPDSNVAVSICTWGISGFIQDGRGETYYLMPDASGPGKIVVTRDSDKIPVKHICGVDSESVSINGTMNKVLGRSFPKKSKNRRIRRSFSPPSSSDRNSLYVELVMVGDVKLFNKYQKNETRLINRFIEITSIVNALYTPLDIFVILTGVEIWTEIDKITMSNDSETTLKNFLRYRKKDLILRMPNDNAYLITYNTLDGSVVGKALKGQMCTYDYSGGIAKDHSHLSGPVGSTVAHEMGHNFGMEHDFTDCKCPDDRCIMTPASVGQTPSNWSSCSRKYLEDHLSRGIGLCLKRVPKKAIAPYCGNGFLEDGEECDCGPEDFCRNKCCIAATCTLSINSTCGHGSCCNMTTCSPRPAATPCRVASGECDLPEYCDGRLGTCPADFWTADGVPCQNGQAYCFDGNCKTHMDQCNYLWGSTGAVADDKCFQLNVNGNPNGNCGHDKISDNYTKCADPDVKCGLLHCTSQVERLSVGSESATSITQSYIPARTTYISCRSAYVDLGLEVDDPGLVPSGAKCGDDMMCYNQVCTEISRVAHKCGGNCGTTGICNNAGHCHCDVGYAPPNCYSSGYGGSVDSGPASSSDSHLHLRNAMLVIFLLVLPLIGGALFVCRHRIRDWMLMKQKLRRAGRQATQADAAASKKPLQSQSSVRGLRISEPVSVADTGGDTVVSVTLGNGKVTHTQTQLAQEPWPVIRQNGFLPASASGRKPPPLPLKPPKAVREIPVATVYPVVPLPDQNVLFKKKNSAGEEVPLSLVKPVRPAPPPPPRPPASPSVSRNSSTIGTGKRQRPLVRPPDPPNHQGGLGAGPRQYVMAAGQRETNVDASQPKNSFVFELARKFENQKGAGRTLPPD